MRSLALAAALAMAGNYMPRYRYKGPRVPKNKYNLTPEQVEQMKSMSPKDKKKFLKGLK